MQFSLLILLQIWVDVYAEKLLNSFHHHMQSIFRLAYCRASIRACSIRPLHAGIRWQWYPCSQWPHWILVCIHFGHDLAVASDRSIRISVHLGFAGVHLAFSSREWSHLVDPLVALLLSQMAWQMQWLVADLDDDLSILSSFSKFHRDLPDFDIHSPFLGLLSFA